METPSRRVPPEKRKRTETSCDKCKSRKQKCDRLLEQSQCRYCEIHGLGCTTTQPRKRRFGGSPENLLTRLALLESLVQGLVPEADLSTNEEMAQLGERLGIPVPTRSSTEDAYGEVEKPSNLQDDESALPLLPDQQGQVQYIGPSSSFSFHLNLRRLIGPYSRLHFLMFGRNAADQDDDPDKPNFDNTGDSVAHRERTDLYSVSSECGSPSDAVRDVDPAVLDQLIDTYFDHIHSDFPVLHEASFREAYETWRTSASVPDPAWLCGLLCVLILSRRVALVEVPDAAERKWWRHVKTLLPSVFFATSIHSVRTLMLAALQLHNTEHRDACWNLTGTAVRVAIAIGLHRDDIKHSQGLLGRELRKQLWWTLYAFEQMQVSSYDRPSAISGIVSSVGFPNERIVGLGGQYPHDLMRWSQRLVVLLGSACKALNGAGTGSTSAENAYSRPLSPAAGVLRDLKRWKDALPPHLRLKTSESLSPSSQRPLLLLHGQYHYIVILLTRSALLSRATILSKSSHEAVSDDLVKASETCVESGNALARLLRKLDAIQRYNSLTWWDIFYTVMAALVLVLDIECRVRQHGTESATEPRGLLRDLARLTSKHLKNPRTPGTMQSWGILVVEVGSMIDQFALTPQSREMTTPVKVQYDGSEVQPVLQDHLVPVGLEASDIMPRTGSIDSTNMGIADLAPDNAPQFWEHFSSFMDGSDWRWDEVDAILRTDSAAQGRVSGGRR